jgi:hypothetical protein
LKTIKFAVVAVAMSVLAAVPARAADTQALQFAHQILEATHASAMADQMLSQMMDGMAGSLNQANPGRQAEVQAVLNDIVVPEFRRAIPDLIEQNAQAYADTFSLEELKQIVAFYQTPLGHTMADKQPALTRAQADVDNGFGRTFFERVGPRLDQALAARRLISPRGGN